MSASSAHSHPMEKSSEDVYPGFTRFSTGQEPRGCLTNAGGISSKGNDLFILRSTRRTCRCESSAQSGTSVTHNRRIGAKRNPDREHIGAQSPWRITEI